MSILRRRGLRICARRTVFEISPPKVDLNTWECRTFQIPKGFWRMKIRACAKPIEIQHPRAHNNYDSKSRDSPPSARTTVPILPPSRSAMGTPMSLTKRPRETTTWKSNPFSFPVFCQQHSSCTSLLWCCSRVGCSCARRQRSLRLLPPGRVLGCTTPSPPRRHFRSFPVRLAALSSVQSVQISWARVPFFSSILQSPSEPAQSAPHPLERPSMSPPLRTSVKVYNLDVEGAPHSRWIGAVDLVPYPVHSTSSVPRSRWVATNPSASTIISTNTFP